MWKNKSPVISLDDFPDMDTYEVERDGFLAINPPRNNNNNFYNANALRSSSSLTSSSSVSSSVSSSTFASSADATASYGEDEDFIVMVNSTEQRKKKQHHQKHHRKVGSSGDANHGGSGDVEPLQELTEEAKQLKAKAVAAGITTGSISLFIAGPIIATIVGFGTKYVAQNDNVTPIGEAARNIGEITLDATEKIKEIDQNHHISKNATKKVQEMDEHYGITQKSNEISVKLQQTVLHHKENVLSKWYYQTKYRMDHLNDKYGISDKVNHLWYEFEKNVLLTEDDLEFDRQMQYLMMERQLEQEELERQHKLMQMMNSNTLPEPTNATITA